MCLSIGTPGINDLSLFILGVSIFRHITVFFQERQLRQNGMCFCGSESLLQWRSLLPYFYGHKTVFFSLQNNPKNLDLSYNKMDLDMWDCSGRVKLVLLQNYIGLI